MQGPSQEAGKNDPMPLAPVKAFDGQAVSRCYLVKKRHMTDVSVLGGEWKLFS